jgi:hypothetical protein
MRNLSEVSATFSLLRQLSSELTARETPYSGGYFTTNQLEITAVQLALDDLSREIGNRPKIILLLPTSLDLAERHRRGIDYSDQINGFIRDLLSNGWIVIDMAKAFSETDRSDDITLGCDGLHWTATTNHTIAKFLLTHHRQPLAPDGPAPRKDSKMNG